CRSFNQYQTRTLNTILTIQSLSTLQLLSTRDVWVIENIADMISPIKYLTLSGNFKLDAVFLLLKQLPHLLHLNLNRVDLSFHSGSFQCLFELKCKVKLQLILCVAEYSQFELLLRHLPKLYYLKLGGSFGFYVNERSNFSNGNRWENDIFMKLPLLKQIQINLEADPYIEDDTVRFREQLRFPSSGTTLIPIAMPKFETKSTKARLAHLFDEEEDDSDE
ncbi:unnamed protein product, partial [Didymodactylos carnosus]